MSKTRKAAEDARDAAKGAEIEAGHACAAIARVEQGLNDLVRVLAEIEAKRPSRKVTPKAAAKKPAKRPARKR